MLKRNLTGQKLGLALVLAAAVFIALAPSTAKIAYQAEANTLAVVTCRCVLAAVGIGMFMIATGRTVAFVTRDFTFGPLTGTAQAFGSLGLLLAVAYIDVGLAFLIVFFHPFLVAFVEHVRGNTHLGLLHFALIVCALSGLAMAVSVSLGIESYLGIGAAVLGAIASTVMVLSMSDASKQTDVLSATFSMMVWASVIFLTASQIGPRLGLLDEMAWPTTGIGWIGIVGTGIAFTIGYLLFFAGAMIIGVTRASMLSIIEPVLAILFAMLLVNEWLTITQWLGVALVVGSLLALEKIHARKVKNEHN